MLESALTRSMPSRGAFASALAALASLWLTLACIVLLAAGVAWSFDTGAPATWHVAIPLALMAVNLGAAVACNRAFRSQTPLLVFHLCLIVVMLAIATGRLTYLRGRAEVSQGQAFDGTLVEFEAGPLHPWHVKDLRFVNDGFEIDYAPGRRRADTRNPVRWIDGAGGERHATIGDDNPLVLSGYRFYTSPNKGFAPRVVWHPQGGPPQRGTLHMPPYPVYESVQVVDWVLPGTDRKVVVALSIDEVLIDDTRASRFSLPRDPRLVVRAGGREFALRPGEHAEIAGGRLAFDGLGTWMGYSVYFDPTMPWLLATSLLAVGALGFHLRAKYFSRPWNPQ